jgi:hypothetical protein
MNLKKWWSVMLMAGLFVALSAPSALAWTNRHFGGHQSNFRGHVPQGRAYGWHGQRPAWNHGRANGYQHGRANGYQHHNQWNQRNQWNHRTPTGPHHRGSWGQQSGQFHNSHRPYTNAAYRSGPRR